MTYAALAALFVAATTVIAGLVSWRRRLGCAWWATTALTILGLLLLLTVVFDSLMIAVDLFRYDDEQLLGWSVGLAPIEDLAWPVAAGLLLSSLWELLTRPTGDDERGRSSR